MNNFKNQKGAAFVLTLMIITLFLIFILAQFTQITNTAKQVVTMEQQIDAQLIAEMGVDYLERVLEDFPSSELKLEEYLSDHIPKGKFPVDSDRYFEITIEDFDIEEQPESIFYESRGIAYNKEAVIKNQINISWD